MGGVNERYLKAARLACRKVEAKRSEAHYRRVETAVTASTWRHHEELEKARSGHRDLEQRYLRLIERLGGIVGRFSHAVPPELINPVRDVFSLHLGQPRFSIQPEFLGEQAYTDSFVRRIDVLLNCLELIVRHLPTGLDRGFHFIADTYPNRRHAGLEGYRVGYRFDMATLEECSRPPIEFIMQVIEMKVLELWGHIRANWLTTYQPKPLGDRNYQYRRPLTPAELINFAMTDVDPRHEG